MPKATRQPRSGGSRPGASSTLEPDRAERRADPEAAVDREIRAAAIARGDQLLDGGVDRRVFAADARAGQEAKQREEREIGRSRGRGRRCDVQPQRDEEQPLAAEQVGEPAEAQRAEHGAGEVRARREADLRLGEMQCRTRGERRRHRAGERHLEPVEDPRDAERNDDQRMEAAPREGVEARRNARFDDRARRVRYGCQAQPSRSRIFAPLSSANIPGNVGMNRSPCPWMFASW